MSRKAWFGAGFGVVGGIAVVAGAACYFGLRDVAEPATVGEAVTNFRASGGGGGASPVPEGVYVYATDGFERTDALTGVTHRYPSRSTITVTRDPCGVQMRWDVLKGRSTVWTFCIGSHGWAVAGQDERHTFFGRTERTTYSCPGRGAPFWPKTGPAPALDYLCSTPSASERGYAGVVGAGELRVDGRRVQTVHLRQTSSFTGAIRGTATYDFWIGRKRGAPVRIRMVSRTTNDSPVGEVRYTEDVTLRLRSLAPRQ
jgi:hypothetical protein